VRVGEAAIPALRRAAELPGSKSRREAALVLAGLLSHDAVPPLLAIVSQDREDVRAADELAILSCVDPRGSVPDPSTAWWNWWEGVRHDDALVWFRAAIERLEIQQPPLGALEGGGTIEGQIFLLSLLEREEKWLVERARRELGRLTREDVGELPPRGPARIAWVRERRAELQGLPESATRGPERR
jgi:HEAT repeat protein